MSHIQAILRLRDDDSFWYFVVVNDFYAHLINAGLKRFDDIRLGIVEAQRQTALTWADVVPLLRQMPMLIDCAVATAVLVCAPALSGVLATAWEYSAQEQRQSEKVDRDRAALIDRLQAIEVDVAQIQQSASRGHVDDPNVAAIESAITALPGEDVQRLAANPLALSYSLHVLASLPPEARSAFELANDPATTSGLRRQQVQAWFSSQVTEGNPTASKLVAAYAAGSAKLMALSQALSNSCGLTSLDACR